jgi:tryptophanyl-tRNA synthetase
MFVETARPIILTGDRTTGPLHLGHYAGSLRNRVALQHTHQQFVLLADAQALTDNIDNPEKVRRNVMEVALDYLAVGIDPRETTFKATVVPVGLDQSPMIEQTNEIVRRINRQIGRELLLEAKPLIPATGRLPGVDGKAKMSKSQGNAISLSATPNEIRTSVNRMYTDPNHLRASDPGIVEGNIVFTYLDAFDTDRAAVDELKERYRGGGVGDVTVKRRLEDVLQELLKPIRERRAAVSNDLGYVLDVLRSGTSKARAITQSTFDELRDGLGLFSLEQNLTKLNR